MRGFTYDYNSLLSSFVSEHILHFGSWFSLKSEGGGTNGVFLHGYSALVQIKTRRMEVK